MLPKGRLIDGAKELREFTSTYTTAEGNLIRGRAFARPVAGEARYEIVVDGFGQYAVVDVPTSGELKRVMKIAMDAFAASARLRGSFSVQLG